MNNNDIRTVFGHMNEIKTTTTQAIEDNYINFKNDEVNLSNKEKSILIEKFLIGFPHKKIPKIANYGLFDFIYQYII